MDLFKKFMDKLQKGERKKLIENTVVIAIIGIIILIASSSLLGGSKKNNTTANSSTAAVSGNTSTVSARISEEEKLEQRMKEILEQINGAGKVDIMVTFSTESEIVPAYDTKKSESKTSEKDSSGGTRDITQSNSDSSVVFEDSGSGAKSPVILKSLLPEIKGVVVVADGASRAEVKERITMAVQVLMDIPIHKIQVIERKK